MSAAPDGAASAELLLADAFARRYRYPENFEGFTARAHFGTHGSTRSATVAMCGPAESAVLLDDPGDPGPDAEWLGQELRALSRRLYGHDYAPGEGRFAKSLVDDPNPLGPLVVLHDDPHEATFRVRGGRITVETRRSGALLQVMRTERWHVRPDSRWLPARYVVEFWDDAVAAPLRVERYWDLYAAAAGELLPSMRRVQVQQRSGTEVRTLTLSEWLLADGTVPPGLTGSTATT